MKKYGYCIFRIFLLFTLLIACSKEGNEALEGVISETENVVVLSNTARVIGYLPYYRFSLSEEIAFCKLTHLNLAFANIDENANLIFPSSSGGTTIETIIARAKERNPQIQIYISLAGGGVSEAQRNYWRMYIDQEEMRPILIEKILQFVTTYGFDGVDLDLEWDNVTAGYSEFVMALSVKLKENTISLSAAYPSETKYSYLSNEALGVLDFVNIMAYDYTGPWNATNVGPHSSFSHARQGINFWTKQPTINPLDLNLGLPFYGYDFQNGTVVAKTFASIIKANPEAADSDQIGNLYYNGRPTIRSKTILAAQEVGGIMIWELGQDALGDYSLLETIHQTYAALEVFTSAACEN